MRNIFIFIPVFFLSILSSYSQSEKVLLTIGNHSVSLQEFEYSYKKNNLAGIPEKPTVEEYLDMFVNFKLKVIEAEELGMDTVKSFINELSGYREQLANAFLNDTTVREEMMKEQYEKMKFDLHVNLISLPIDPKASPADTLAVYNKLIDLRKKILAGEKFDTIAKELSDNQSGSENKGDIGWISAFRTKFDLECALYNAPINQLSMPFRTPGAYVLFKVTDKRPSLGKVRVANIFVIAPEDMDEENKKRAEMKIFALYDSLDNSIQSFAELANKYSEDRRTAENNGVLPWFGINQTIPAFEEAAFSLKLKYQYTKPFKSSVGWHIVQLIDKKGLGTYEEERSDIFLKMNEPSIINALKQKMIDKLKKEHQYLFNLKNLKKMYSLVDTTIFEGLWSDSLLRNKNDVLFSLGSKNYSVADFAAYLQQNQKKIKPYSINVFLNEQFLAFSTDLIISTEKEMLPNKFPEFKNIIQEYHDGILLFDLTDKMVWTKALMDTAGLEKFYSENKNQYQWNKRADAMVFSCGNATLLNEIKEQVVKYGKKKRITKDYILSKLCPNDSTKSCITITEGLFEKGYNEEVDKVNWKLGAGEIYQSGTYTWSFIFIRDVLEPQIKKLDEARGIVISDYQNSLEKAWIAELRAKHPVKVDYGLLKSVK